MVRWLIIETAFKQFAQVGLIDVLADENELGFALGGIGPVVLFNVEAPTGELKDEPHRIGTESKQAFRSEDVLVVG